MKNICYHQNDDYDMAANLTTLATDQTGLTRG